MKKVVVEKEIFIARFDGSEESYDKIEELCKIAGEKLGSIVNCGLRESGKALAISVTYCSNGRVFFLNDEDNILLLDPLREKNYLQLQAVNHKYITSMYGIRMSDEMSDEEILKEMGWTIECQSPFEIRHEDGSFASGQAAQYCLDNIKKEFDEL